MNEGRIGIGRKYARYFSKFGTVVLLNPLDRTVNDIDLLVLPGGADVNPDRYNEPRDLLTQRQDPFFEDFDNHVLPLYVEAGTPIFGICRGFQSGSVFFGAKLNQHVDNYYSTKSRGELVDSIFLTNVDALDIPQLSKFPTRRVTNNDIKKLPKVNSLHHQTVALHPGASSGEMFGLAFNVLDGECEAGYAASYPFIGVQWHPEELKNPVISNLLIKSLLDENN
jgi:putative glutamine amidotransferase